MFGFCFFVFACSKTYTGKQQGAISASATEDYIITDCFFELIGSYESSSAIFIYGTQTNPAVFINYTVFTTCKANQGGSFSIDGNFKLTSTNNCIYDCQVGGSSKKGSIAYINDPKTYYINLTSAVNCKFGSKNLLLLGAPNIYTTNVSKSIADIGTESASFGTIFCTSSSETVFNSLTLANGYSPNSIIYFTSCKVSKIDYTNIIENEITDSALIYVGNSEEMDIINCIISKNKLNGQKAFVSDNSLIRIEGLTTDANTTEGSVQIISVRNNPNVYPLKIQYFGTHKCYAEKIVAATAAGSTIKLVESAKIMPIWAFAALGGCGLIILILICCIVRVSKKKSKESKHSHKHYKSNEKKSKRKDKKDKKTEKRKSKKKTSKAPKGVRSSASIAQPLKPNPSTSEIRLDTPPKNAPPMPESPPDSPIVDKAQQNEPKEKKIKQQKSKKQQISELDNLNDDENNNQSEDIPNSSDSNEEVENAEEIAKQKEMEERLKIWQKAREDLQYML